MRLTTRGSRFCVIDDFLPLDAWEELRHLHELGESEEVPSVIDASVDGSASRSRGLLLRYDSAALSSSDEDIPRGFGHVLKQVAGHEEVFGVAGTDWRMIGASFWTYTVGARLGWHDDAGGGRTGEFVLFLHPTWHVSWGGELLIHDEDTSVVAGAKDRVRRLGAWVSGSDRSLTAIVPRPNRLVLVKAGTAHCINRVDQAAGAAERRTFTGFASLQERPQHEDMAVRLQRLQALVGEA